MAMIGPQLCQLQREFNQIVDRVRRLELLAVPDAARLLNKSRAWVRGNLPVIIHSPKVHGVRLADIEAYQLRRTVWPKGEFPSAAGRRAA